MTFLALAHMVDATQVIGCGGRGCMRCIGTHVGCYATAHTCFILRNCMCSCCSYHARMGWGVGCSWLHGLSWHTLGCYATAHTCFMLRNCTCSYFSYHARIGGGGRGCMRCLGTHVGCYAAAHTCFIPRMRITQICSRSAAHKWPRCDTRETSE